LGSPNSDQELLAEAEGNGLKLIAQSILNLIFKLQTATEQFALDLIERINMLHGPLDKTAVS